MISAKNKKTNLTQTFSEKDWKDIQFHFPNEWEQVEFENVEVSNESELIIEVVKPKVNSEQLEKMIEETTNFVKDAVKFQNKKKRKK